MAVGVVAIFISEKIKTKVIELFTGVLEGVKTILKLKQRTAYIAHTLFIWACYVGMIWVCSFALPETAGLNISAVFAAFVVGAVVSGTIIWQVWRFRESHPKAKPTPYEGTDW